MILITTYYKSNNILRQKEIDKCLLLNSQNIYIKKIYLLNDKIYNLPLDIQYYKKIVQIEIDMKLSNKLKYSDAISFINNNLKDEICILSNSDIYFDNTLHKINNRIIRNKCFALLRYNESINNIFTLNGMPRSDSQDCWIFRSPLNIDINKLDFAFGTLGCDSIFSNLIYDSGLIITNPCYDIITIHLHDSEYRTYNIENRIHGTYCLLKPCTLNEIIKPTFIEY
jgi:hypothetical protein